MNIRHILTMVLIAALSCILHAQETAIPTPAKDKPFAAELLRAVHKNQATVEALVKNYIFDKDVTEQETDKDGKVKKTTAEQFEVFYLGHEEIERRLKKNGVELSESDQKKEQEKVDKKIREYKKRASSDSENDKKNEMTVESFLRCSRFMNPRGQQFRGKQVVVFDFEPSPNCNAASRAEKVLAKVDGVIWIDEEANQVVRMEAHLIDAFKVGGGILGAIQKGTELVFEQEKVNDEVWLPSNAEVHYGARLLFKGMHGNIHVKYSNYQKFRVDTVIKPATAEKLE